MQEATSSYTALFVTATILPCHAQGDSDGESNVVKL
jgi:hypothetical protein